MAALPHEHHGNCPYRQMTLLSQRISAGSWKIEEEFCCDCDCKTTSSSRNQLKQPVLTLPALLKRIRVHPEAKRILGNSYIPVVSLERLNLQSFLSLQPVVSLVRLPRQTPTDLHSDVSLNNHHQQQQQRQHQNALTENNPDLLELRQISPEFTPTDLSDPPQPETPVISWTEPCCPDITPTEEPEQSFDCESHSDQPYILFDCGSDEWSLNGKMYSETFYLDPDPEQTIVIEVDPEPDVNSIHPLQLEDETEAKCLVDVVEVVEDEDQPAVVCCTQAAEEEEGEAFIHQPEPGEVADERENDDFCAVCLNGGDLLCCDRCPKVYHLACHVPPVVSFPLGDWACTLCRTDEEPAEGYDCESVHSCGGVKAPYTLSSRDQKRCEKLTLLLYCHWLSAPFHEPVSPLARNYYQIIKRPIDLSLIRRKLDKSRTLHYFSPEQFVDDVLLMFRNCATFNYPDSEVAQAGQNLETFFLTKLQEIFPDRTFVQTSQDRKDTSRVQLLRREKKENHRKKKRYVFSGKKYYL